jgi:hypothetical protein
VILEFPVEELKPSYVKNIALAEKRRLKSHPKEFNKRFKETELSKAFNKKFIELMERNVKRKRTITF